MVPDIFMFKLKHFQQKRVTFSNIFFSEINSFVDFQIWKNPETISKQ